MRDGARAHAAPILAAHLIDRAHDRRPLDAATRIGARAARRASLAAVAGAVIITILITDANQGADVALRGRKFALLVDCP